MRRQPEVEYSLWEHSDVAGARPAQANSYVIASVIASAKQEEAGTNNAAGMGQFQ